MFAAEAQKFTMLTALCAAVISGCANPLLDMVTGREAVEEPVLPATAIVSPSVVQQSFPVLTRSAGGGDDPTAPGEPLATRRSEFTDPMAMGRLTVAVAEYASETSAMTTFAALVEELRYTSGFVEPRRPDVGEDSLAAVTRPAAGPMRVTVVALERRNIIQVASTGFGYSRDHVEGLVVLAHKQIELLANTRSAPG
jgi:hypothetical protein